MLGVWARYLTFRARDEDWAQMSWRRCLGPGLIATWVVGMGRYWDHPTAHWLQLLGVGSVIYVFVLGGLLWALIAPLRPQGWTYLQVVTLVSLTAPPALLYAIPVERWMTVDAASTMNVRFLAAVAGWRVALLLFTLRRYARLTWPRTLVGSLLPLSAIVTTLTALDFQKAVFAAMAGLRDQAANHRANNLLVLVTALAFGAVLPLFVSYLVLVYRARIGEAQDAPVRLF